MKKVLLALMVLMVVAIGTSFTAFAEETVTTGSLAGVWSVNEDYGTEGTYTATWTFTSKSRIVYSLVAARPGGYVVDGIGIELGNKVIVALPSYYGLLCNYTYKGTITGSTISGTALFKCADGNKYPGTFTATKASGAAEDKGEAEGSPDPE